MIRWKVHNFASGYRSHENKDNLNRSIYSIWATDESCPNIVQLTNKLKNLFPSIENYEELSLDFVFSDPADEAAFLLWSSDGIEI